MKTKILLIFSLFLVFFLVYSVVYPSFFNKGVEFTNKTLRVSLPNIKERDFSFGLDLQGGAYLLYEADLDDVELGERSQRMNGLRDLIARRVDFYGVGESTVQVRGDRLSVEIPGAHDLQEAIDMIGETPFLDFRELSEELAQKQEDKWSEIVAYLGKPAEEIDIEDLMLLEEDIEDWQIVMMLPYTETGLTGRHLETARVSMHHITQEPVIELVFNSEGADLFEEITARNIGKPVATFLDGEVLQIATVQEKIGGGRAQITGSFTMEEAYDTVRDLRIGALPVAIELLSQRSIGPSLGEESLQAAIMAGTFGFVLVALFMIVFYRLLGVFAVATLGSYVLLIVFLFKIIPVTLTLSGMAGFILSVGMAIDGNILIISRMREEMREGKSIRKSIEAGYEKAWSSIRDGNFTTLMVAVVLFFITTSFVRGFAITLILGIFVSLLCVMIVKKALLLLAEDSVLGKIEKIWK